MADRNNEDVVSSGPETYTDGGQRLSPLAAEQDWDSRSGDWDSRMKEEAEAQSLYPENLTPDDRVRGSIEQDEFDGSGEYKPYGSYKKYDPNLAMRALEIAEGFGSWPAVQRVCDDVNANSGTTGTEQEDVQYACDELDSPDLMNQQPPQMGLNGQPIAAVPEQGV